MMVMKMADPYGITQTSPIANPSAGTTRGEPIPAPGKLPPQYPAYLKPIPINTRDIEAVMRGYLNAREPEVMRILYSTWNASREAVKYQEIRNAIRDGEFSPQFLARFEEDYALFVNDTLAPEWRAAINASAQNMGQAIESRFGVFPRFNEASERISEWIQTRGGELAVNLSRDQHRALASTLEFFTVQNPVGADEMGRIIRANVGLTANQAAAVRRFRQQLAGNEELDPRSIIHQVENYAARLHRLRAERIARTELAFSFNFGGLEQMRQANEEELAGDEIIKRWYTSQDERVCTHCGPLHNQVVGLEETFPGATRKIPNTYTPPAHPSCRCTVIYEVLEAE